MRAGDDPRVPARALGGDDERGEERDAVLAAAGGCKHFRPAVVASAVVVVRTSPISLRRDDIPTEARHPGDFVREAVLLPGVEDVRLPVDEHAVVVLRDSLEEMALAQLRAYRRGLVEDVAESENRAPPGGLHLLERRLELSPDAEGMLVREHHRGPERLDRREQDARTHRAHVAPRDVEPAGRVAAVADLAEARKLEDVDGRRNGEALDLLRARREEDRRLGFEVRQSGCDREVPPQMPQTEAVMRVEEKTAYVPDLRGACLGDDGVLGQAACDAHEVSGWAPLSRSFGDLRIQGTPHATAAFGDDHHAFPGWRPAKHIRVGDDAIVRPCIGMHRTAFGRRRAGM
jgi:hypothetical protein